MRKGEEGCWGSDLFRRGGCSLLGGRGVCSVLQARAGRKHVPAAGRHESSGVLCALWKGHSKVGTAPELQLQAHWGTAGTQLITGQLSAPLYQQEEAKTEAQFNQEKLLPTEMPLQHPVLTKLNIAKATKKKC